MHQCITVTGSEAVVQCTDAALVGSHSVDVVRDLDRYPSAVSLTETASVTIYSVVVPSSPDTQTYTIMSEMLTFSLDLPSINPAAPDSVAVSYSVTQADGSALDSFIGYDVAASTVDFSVYSVDNLKAGSYTLLITLNAVFYDSSSGVQVTSSSDSYSCSLEVLEASVNFAPIFVDPLPELLSVEAGQSLAYTVPQIEDLEGDDFVLSCNLGNATSFVTFDGSSFSSAEIEAGRVGSYPILLVIEDTGGASSQYTLLVLVDNSSASEEMQALPDEQTSGAYSDIEAIRQWLFDMQIETDWLQAYIDSKMVGERSDFVFPVAKISSISAQGLITLKFTKTMKPAPVELIEWLRVGDEPALKLTLLPGDYSDPDRLGYTQQIIAYSQTQIQIKLSFENPVEVSADIKEPESVKIEFPGYQYFFDSEGLSIASDTLLVDALPPQIPEGGLAAAIEENQVLAQAIVQVLVGGNFVINLVFAASL